MAHIGRPTLEEAVAEAELSRDDGGLNLTDRPTADRLPYVSLWYNMSLNGLSFRDLVGPCVVY